MFSMKLRRVIDTIILPSVLTSKEAIIEGSARLVHGDRRGIVVQFACNLPRFKGNPDNRPPRGW
jgi:hypothetical protein